MKPRRTDVRKLFFERMKREGRVKEYQAKIKELQAQTGQKFGRVQYDAMKACGYTTPDEERALAESATSGAARDAAEADGTNIYTIRDTLPERAPVAQEINWVMSNEAMFRRARNRHDEIHVTVKDLLGPPRCPSKAALTILQQCVNSPTEFYKQFFAEMKKQIGKDDDKGAETVEDADLADVERMLKEVAA